jgi:uncharacterized protein
MTLHCVHLHDTPAQPWRNGGGITHELLTWPESAAWQLRVSLATIDRSGPFSAFPGVERWFQVLHGAGVRLAWPNEMMTLTPGSAAVHFAGENPPGCELLDGPTRDLNLMARRDAGLALMQPAHKGAIEGTTKWRGLYTAAALTLEVNGIAQPVQADSLIWSDTPEPASWRVVEPSAPAWWLTLTP